MLQAAYKTPVEIKDYTIDWQANGNPVLAVGETISTSVWDAGGATDIGISPPSATHTNTTATVWLSDGTVANIYTITNTITTSQGREFTASFSCHVNALNPVGVC